MQPKVSTITLSTQIPNCTLNLTNIGKYLDIDDTILGIKYSYGAMNVLKGKYLTTIYKKAKAKNIDKVNKTLFYNQVSLVVQCANNQVNVKLFGNGSLHITGCKFVEEGYHVTRMIIKKLKYLVDKKNTIVLCQDENGVYLDKDNLVYSQTSYQIIGHKQTLNSYIIHKKEYEIDFHTGLFISKKIETGRRRNILDFEGDYVGSAQIQMLKAKNKFYKKNNKLYFDRTSNLIHYNNDNIIGKVVYDLDQAEQSIDTKCQNAQENVCDLVVETEYQCNPFLCDHTCIDEQTEISLHVNCINVYFNIDYEINRQRLYEWLISKKYLCRYKPESYSGIKLVVKVPVDFDQNSSKFSGKCTCSSKCLCTNITFLIFQSGNVIATGFKNTEHILPITHFFSTLLSEMQDIVKKKF